MLKSLLGQLFRPRRETVREAVPMEERLRAALGHQQDGRLAEAEAIYRALLGAVPPHADVMHLLASNLMLQRRHREAVELLERVTSLRPSFVTAHSNYVYALNFDPGYEPQRVFEEHLQWARSHAEPLRRFIPHQADIALDPFPFSGTTTCHSLWMGLPVVTLAGESHVSRVRVSMLTNIGLTGMIVDSVDDYVNIATGLANDLGSLRALRGGLRDRMLNSPLTDAGRFARHLEERLRQIWTSWCGPKTSTEKVPAT